MGRDSSRNAEQDPAHEQAAVAAIRLATAYQASRALHVALRLALPDSLAGGPRQLEELALETGAHAASLRRLMRSLAAYGVFSEDTRGWFSLGPLGACLVTDAPGSVRPLALMWGDEDYWTTWAELERCVRTGQTAANIIFGAKDAFQRYSTDARFGAVFNAGMTTLSALTAAAVVAVYDFASARLAVDIGGGQGHLIAAILRANPGLRGVVLDLPSVVERAPDVLAKAGVADRCAIVGGDMFAEVPAGADIYLLSRVIDSFDEDRAIALLRKCRAAMGDCG